MDPGREPCCARLVFGTVPGQVCLPVLAVVVWTSITPIPAVSVASVVFGGAVLALCCRSGYLFDRVRRSRQLSGLSWQLHDQNAKLVCDAGGAGCYSVYCNEAAFQDVPLHLLLIGPDWDAVKRLRTALVQDMLRAGWRVTIAAGSPEGDDAAAFRQLGVECVTIPVARTSLNLASGLGLMAAVWRLCRRIRPDAVLAITVKPVTFGLIAAALARVPVRAGMITGLGYAFTDGRELKRRIVRQLVGPLYALSLRTATRAFFQNDDDIADFRRQGLLPDSLRLTRTNGSGVDLAHYDAVPLPTGDPTFVMVARLLVDKGVREYADAARMVRARNPRVTFRLVGALDSNPAAVTQEELDEWVAEGIIDYVGYHADIRSVLQSAHVFVLPSYREGTPRSGLEALAMGRPILTTDVPGCREIVQDKVTGRLVAVRSAAAVADAVEWFIDNESAWPSMAAAARQDAEHRFDVHAVNNVVMSALEADLARITQL